MEFELSLLEMNEVMHQLLARHKEQVVGGSFGDITTSDLFYVEAIYRLGTPTITRLAEHLNVSKASTTIAIQKLVKKGVATKTQSTGDRRIMNVSLTDRGLTLMKIELDALHDVASSIKSLLTAEEVEQTAAILKKITSHYRNSRP